VRGSRGARLAALLIAVILAAVFPFWANRSQPYYLQIAINIIIFAVLALSWDILARTGQLSLAHAAFYGLGAYTSALLTLRAGVPVVVAIILGGVVAMGAAGAAGGVASPTTPGAESLTASGSAVATATSGASGASSVPVPESGRVLPLGPSPLDGRPRRGACREGQ